MKQQAWRGAISGVAATFWMSSLMLLARKLLPTPTLPPREIVEAAVEATAGRGKADPMTIKATSVVAHFAFGAAVGALFGMARGRIQGEGITQGIGFGLLVWALSYRGWVPALKIIPSAPEDDPRRARTMFAAHIVYGATLGASMRRM